VTPTLLPPRDLVLVGAGHTNLHIVRMWRMQPIEGVRLSLVSPFSRATYSGMLPGTLAGLYQPEEMEIDLWRFAESCGARLIVDEVIGIAPRMHRILFADRPPVRYDVASIGIGSVPGGRESFDGDARVLSIKPMATFRVRLEQALASTALARASHESTTVAVVGAGAGGVEVAFSIDALLRARRLAANVALVDGHSEILSGYTSGTVIRARRELDRRGINLHLGERVTSLATLADGRTALALGNGARLPADLVIWATAAAPPPVFRQFGLPLADDGFLAVRPTLQTTADFPVFAVGDSASLTAHPLPKAGVYAVRQGPVLWENLQRIFSGRPLVPFEPQKGFLSLLSTGDSRAIMEYKGISAHSSWAWSWKDRIDRRFMRMYQNYEPRGAMPAVAPRGVAGHAGNALASGPAAMRCFGCGSKIGAGVLRAALERLPLAADHRALIGLDHPDDAVVIDRDASPIDVLSVDFFPAFLDDPYLVGRVAALNALSDLWAMGARPLGAMAHVTLPAGSETQQTELLFQALAGGLRELSVAGASLWGGHTIEGSELTLGYTVTGSLDGKPPLTKGGLRAGDLLYLTKPLGIGALLAAQRDCRCPARCVDAMLVSMLESNARGARAARAAGVTAATDVTGFGLAGHLVEMLTASGVSARVSLESLPLLDGFRELAEKGYRSSLDRPNRSVESNLVVEDEALRHASAYQALFDPQTSGGLLIGVASGQFEALRAELPGWMIGSVTAGGAPGVLTIAR
jgi:selenide, water dikinase